MPPTLQIKPLGPLASAITSLFQPPSTNIRGVETSSWFGPLQPVKPIAPAGTEPRGLQYFPGQNLNFVPRSNEPLTFEQLREAARYDMVRVIIENVKDQLCRMVPEPRLRRLPGESTKDYAKRKPDVGILNAISDLIRYPSGERSESARSEFTRHILEDMLVIDAPAILFRTTRSKDLVEVRAIDGATITRYIDEQGFTPQPPSPAYAQLWQGMPMVDLTTDQLLYAPRNILPGHLYGLSPTEQVINFIRFGRDRLDFQTKYYTDGTLPDAIQVVPIGTPVNKIQEAQLWMNSELSGNLAKRRQLRLMQGFTDDGKDQIIFPKEVLLTDGTDEVIFRALFYTFGQSATRVIPMMNRATADQNQAAAEKEGLEPYAEWLSGVWNRIIQRYLGFRDYEIAFEDDTDVDPLKQATIDASDVDHAIRTTNECREDRGYAPVEDVPEAGMLRSSQQITLLSSTDDAERAKAKAEAMPKPELGGAPGGPVKPAEKAFLAALVKLQEAADKVLQSEHEQRIEKRMEKIESAPPVPAQQIAVNINAEKLEMPQHVTVEAPVVHVAPPDVHVKVEAPQVHVGGSNIVMPVRKTTTEKIVKRDSEGNITKVIEHTTEE